MPDLFLQSHGLPAAWAGRAHWCVLDTDFDQGLRFLATWQAWRTDPQRCRMLHAVALCPEALQPHRVRQAATPYPALQPLADTLAAQCWGLLPGLHRIALDQGRVLLTLCVGDAATLWHGQAFHADTVHSAPAHGAGAPLDLAPAGPDTPTAPQAPGRCAVVGAGIAGACVAASLARRGWQVQVLDGAAHPAAGASGLPLGLFAPHVSPDDAPLSRLTRAGIRATLAAAAPCLHSGHDGQACGVLERGLKNARQLPKGGGAAVDQARREWSHPASADQRHGTALPADEPALWHGRAGWLRPARWVQLLLAQPGITWQGNACVARLSRHGDGWHLHDATGALLAQADLVVVASGHGSAALLDSAAAGPPQGGGQGATPGARPSGPSVLPLQALRGQVSMGPLPASAQALPQPVNGHGSVITWRDAAGAAQWIVGSTFQRGRTDTAVDPADHPDNLARLALLAPQLAATAQAALARGEVRGWAGVRATLPDRLPAVGPVDATNLPGLWACTGMGARGLSLAALCGELLAARLHGEPLPLEASLARALAADRFKGKK